MNKEQIDAMHAQSDAYFAKIRALPGYKEVEAEVRAENEAAKLLAEIMAESKMTQRQIAEKIGVSQPYISKIKTRGDISLATLFKVAQACGATLKITATF